MPHIPTGKYDIILRWQLMTAAADHMRQDQPDSPFIIIRRRAVLPTMGACLELRSQIYSRWYVTVFHVSRCVFNLCCGGCAWRSLGARQAVDKPGGARHAGGKLWKRGGNVRGARTGAGLQRNDAVANQSHLIGPGSRWYTVSQIRHVNYYLIYIPKTPPL